ncbi:MAG: hypothetical protein CYG60_15570 [Actinobacteria bacterium]|nr:MAG: hypothetical protein CYG60_15570 [Actinomycetota bacterium]
MYEQQNEAVNHRLVGLSEKLEKLGAQLEQNRAERQHLLKEAHALAEHSEMSLHQAKQLIQQFDTDLAGASKPSFPG